jgi:DNA-binding transcriptional regulator LsrR (DeoR family)
MGAWSPKQEEKVDMAARVAWHYYVDGQTQNDIAKGLRISRPTVQRMNAVALDRGFVTVRVHHKIGECVELARILRQRYNLSLCEVVPSSSDDYDQVLRRIAVAGAEVMESYLQQIEPMIFGLSIGRTVKSVINELTAISRPQQLPKKPVIAFAAGKRKVKAVLATLRGHWINGLVTDQTCAQRILAIQGKV